MNPTDHTDNTETALPLRAAVYLLPVPLSEGGWERVLPAWNVKVMRPIRHFAVENVRSARRFLRSVMRDFPIDECTFSELSEHTALGAVEVLLEPVRKGLPLGVISEAGCPAVADPGASVVAAAQRAGIEVVPLVGPSSILMSLMGSGFDGQSFAFQGYLPVDEGQRARRLRELEKLAAKGQTQIFIETPYRNNKLVAELSQQLRGDLRLCVACDVTGATEEITTRPVREWAKAKYNYDKRPAIFLIYR